MTKAEFDTLRVGDKVTAEGNFRDGKVTLTAEVMEKASYKIREVPNKPDQATWKHMVHIRVISPRRNFRNRTAWFDHTHLDVAK